MNKTITFFSALAILSASQLIAMDHPTETSLDKCKEAFKEIETHNGANIWKKNLRDHCSETPVDGRSCFSTTAENLPNFFKEKKCEVTNGEPSSKNVARCDVICENGNIGWYGNGELTNKIYFTIQNATNNKGYKYLIFNIYPQG